MTERPKEDNVIYANFGARKRVSSAEETGAPTRSFQQRSLSPAALRIANAAVRQTDVGRVKRGTEYAARGHVVELRVVHGGVRAAVVGSQNEPFQVGMHLPYRSYEDIRRAVGDIVRAPGSIAAAKAGTLDEHVLDILLCDAPQEVTFSCDCPDGANVCKHAIAVAQRAAELVDDDPTLIFTMRGLSLEDLESRKRNQAEDLARENAEPGSEFFWSGRPLPELPRPKVAPMIEDSDIDLLHRAMQTVSFTNIDQLRAVADIEDLYDELTR
ncbi:SWIM zinc finger family protein [Corynebacterium fournieri]|uniref:SWIM zinc finger family protein n=1 Tax=Corynebacterium fournieri TaxID=1852390 RepID=UPI000A2F51FE|nr:SWIM zinc finger family protein [Corynebacterium fournieri]WJY97336.1 hypothetical protein CFOUR_04545 [Corynebacterium fournieri]